MRISFDNHYRNAPILLGIALVIMFYFNIAHARIDRKVVVHFEVECEDQDTGAVETVGGSGVVFMKTGYVLSAAHTFTCRINGKQFERKSIKTRLGIHRGLQGEADLRASAEQADIAVLKLVSAGETYSYLFACSMAPFEEETPFMSYGFPEAQDYAPVSGHVGAEAEDGNYVAVAAFAPGMSGGPVLIDGHVVALIKAGAADINARRKITPLFRAGSLIRDATGRQLPLCEDIGKFDVSIKIIIEETVREERVRTSPRHGVSTGSLVETKCGSFAFPATQGWSIRPDSVTIVGRISQGSSRANLSNITPNQATADFCARSVMNGLKKKTGDSFGSIRFTEFREQLRRSELFENVRSENGRVLITLPANTTSWQGQISELGSEEAIEFAGTGNFRGFDITQNDGATLEILMEK